MPLSALAPASGENEDAVVLTELPQTRPDLLSSIIIGRLLVLSPNRVSLAAV
jgi:hypothetical protein